MSLVLLFLKHLLLYLPCVCGAYMGIFLLRVPILAVESAMVFSAVISSLVQQAFPNLPYLALFAAAAASGCAVGMLFTALYYYGRIAPLVCNFILMGLLHGVNQWLMGSSHLAVPACEAPYAILMLAAGLSLIFFSIFCSTQLGHAAAIYGRNSTFLRKQKISIAFVLFGSLGSIYALAGVNGCLLAQVNGFVDLSMAFGMVLMALTCVILGALIVPHHRPVNMLIPLLGIASFMLLQQVLLSCGCSTRYFIALQAALLLVMMIMAMRRTGSPVDFLRSQL